MEIPNLEIKLREFPSEVTLDTYDLLDLQLKPKPDSRHHILW